MASIDSSRTFRQVWACLRSVISWTNTWSTFCPLYWLMPAFSSTLRFEPSFRSNIVSYIAGIFSPAMRFLYRPRTFGISPGGKKSVIGLSRSSSMAPPHILARRGFKNLILASCKIAISSLAFSTTEWYFSSFSGRKSSLRFRSRELPAYSAKTLRSAISPLSQTPVFITL